MMAMGKNYSSLIPKSRNISKIQIYCITANLMVLKGLGNRPTCQMKHVSCTKYVNTNKVAGPILLKELLCAIILKSDTWLKKSFGRN